jgi:integrase
MLRLQELTGMRPCEVCTIRMGEVNQQWDGMNWLYQPKEHKTAGQNIVRSFVFCKECQKILGKYITDDVKQFLFLNQRQNPITPAVYGRAIKKVIDKHKLQKFVPYQVRHNAATWVSDTFDRDHARAFLGHTTEQMTSRYDHADLAKIRQIATYRNEAVERERALAAAVPDEPKPYPPPTILRIYREGGEV